MAIKQTRFIFISLVISIEDPTSASFMKTTAVFLLCKCNLNASTDIEGRGEYHPTSQKGESDPTHLCTGVYDLVFARVTTFSTTKIHVECIPSKEFF